jgi:ABC-type Na+ efflux pump permease subunit
MVHPVPYHSLMCYSLELLRVIPHIAKLTALETITTTSVALALSRVRIKWHQAALTHSPTLGKWHETTT